MRWKYLPAIIGLCIGTLLFASAGFLQAMEKNANARISIGKISTGDIPTAGSRENHDPVIINSDAEYIAAFPTMEISNLNFDGTATGYCLIIGNVSSVTIENCHFANANGTAAVVLNNCTAVVVDGCEFKDSSNGLKITAGSGANIKNNEFKGISGIALYIESTTSSSITNCKIENGGNGIMVKTITGISIDNNDIKNMSGSAIKIDNVTASSLMNNKIDKANYGIYASGGTANNIKNNNVKNCTTDGIRVEGVLASNIEGNEVKACKMGINLQGSNNNNVTSNTATDNTDYDIYESDGTSNNFGTNNAVKVHRSNQGKIDNGSPGFGVIITFVAVISAAAISTMLFHRKIQA